MQVESGVRLGPYEIVSRIGAGGMGEVWKARDTRLDRSVAVKVLPAEFAQNAQFRLRFEREAKTISQLEHPHICRLYDVGDDYLVMELLEGESLAERLARGPLPIAEVLRYGVQIAEALDRAHRAGIVHRDLKPGNVMLTKSGAKLLDFGLAKGGVFAFSPDDATRQKALTQEGTILGTFQYMAPEQLEGAECDARTDIFAFGALLYEMATGKRAFEGKTRTSLIAAIVAATPVPVAQIQPLTPPALDHVIARCLTKDPDDRWQSAHDVAQELRWIGEAGSQAGVAAPLTSRRRTREKTAWTLVSMLVIALVSMLVWTIRERSSRTPPRLMRFRLDLPVTPTIQAAGRTVAVAPDGSRLVFVTMESDVTALIVRETSRVDPVPLAGTEGARFPFFSPDGASIGFFDGGELRKIPAGGGPVQTIVDASWGYDPTWHEDGTIVFSRNDGIQRVSSNGGPIEAVVRLDEKKGHIDYRMPSLLPGGNAVLFAIVDSRGTWLEQNIAVFDLEKRVTKVLRPGTNPRYLATGHLVYTVNGSLFAIPFDPGTLTTTGNPALVAERIATSQASGVAAYDIARDGTLVYASGEVLAAVTKPVWVDRAGVKTPLPLPPRGYEHPRVSPDGSRVLLAVRSNETDVWVWADRGTFGRLTFTPLENETPIWSPDGKRVIFSSSRAGVARAHMAKAADGTGSEQLIFRSDLHQHAGSISPDGKLLAGTSYDPQTASDLWVAPLDGSGKPRVLLQTPFDERAPRFSPDGRWIAYASNESGNFEVYVIGANGSGKWQVSTSGGFAPVWSRDGRELFYRLGKDLLGVTVSSSDGSFIASSPKVILSGEFQNLPRGDANYDVSPDGKRFLVLEPEKAQSSPPVIVVLNWFEELRRATASR